VASWAGLTATVRRSDRTIHCGHISKHGSAARVYGAFACAGEVDGVRVLSWHSAERARTEQANDPDAVIFGLPTRFGLGFSLPPPGTGFGSSSAAAFGCPRGGASIGFADPGAHIGFGYAMKPDAGRDASRPARSTRHCDRERSLTPAEPDKSAPAAGRHRPPLTRADRRSPRHGRLPRDPGQSSNSPHIGMTVTWPLTRRST
jgi:hypothetical protein